MDESYKLSFEQHETIYIRLEKEMLENSSASEAPCITLLGGQPGAGKSKLIEFSKMYVFVGRHPVIINGDDYRKEHPLYLQILREDDKLFVERTDPDVRDWTKRLLDSAIANRRDIIFEGTMRTKGPIMETIQNLKEKGYHIDVLVMAVRGDVSRVGTIARYEAQKERTAYGRWTPPESHDEAYKNMPDTVFAIENESPIDSIRVYNRAGELLYENIRKGGVHHKQPQTADAKAAIEREQTRSLSQEEQRNLNYQRKSVEQKMLARGATAEDISKVKAIMLGIVKHRGDLNLNK